MGNLALSKTNLFNRGESRRFDHVVVIPVYNEEIEDVLRVVHSLAVQNYKKGYIVERAVVICINNSAGENSKNSLIYKQNLAVYNFLLKIINLEHFDSKADTGSDPDKHGLMVGAISDIQKKIKEKSLHIEIIDSFSPGRAQKENNIGFARETGSRFAANRLAKSDRSLLFSTDADSVFGLDTMNAVEDMFSDNDVDLAPLNLDYHFENLEDRVVRAAVRYRLSRDLSTTLYSLVAESGRRCSSEKRATSILLEKAFDLGGAFTVMRVGSYLKSSGYPRVSSKEDLYIAASVSQAGGKLEDLRRDYPSAIVYTSPRVSSRVPEGYGRKISKFISEQNNFLDSLVASVEACLSVSFLIRKLELAASEKEIDVATVQSLSREICPWLKGVKRDTYIKDLLEIFSNKPIKVFSKEHWDLSNKTKKLIRSEGVPSETILEQVKMLEKIYCESPQVLFTDSEFRLIEAHEDDWSFLFFRDFLLNRLRSIKGLDINLVMPIFTVQVAVIYTNIFIRGIKTSLIFLFKKRKKATNYFSENSDGGLKNDKPGLVVEGHLEYCNYGNLLLKCEIKLLTTIKEGHRGLISEELGHAISMRIGKIVRKSQ